MWEKWEYIYTQQVLHIPLLMFSLHCEWNLVKQNENLPKMFDRGGPLAEVRLYLFFFPNL